MRLPPRVMDALIRKAGIPLVSCATLLAFGAAVDSGRAEDVTADRPVIVDASTAIFAIGAPHDSLPIFDHLDGFSSTTLLPGLEPVAAVPLHQEPTASLPGGDALAEPVTDATQSPAGAAITATDQEPARVTGEPEDVRISPRAATLSSDPPAGAAISATDQEPAQVNGEPEDVHISPRAATLSSDPPAAELASEDPLAGEPAAEPDTPAAFQPPVLSPGMLALGHRVQRCLELYRQQPLDTGDYSCWSVMHWFLAYGPDTPVLIGGPKGRAVNAIGWMCLNRPCNGRQLFYLKDGLIVGREGPGYQGHPAQFLAMLAQTGVQPQFPLHVDGKEFTVADLIESEKVTCREDMELTFKLISLVHYLDADASWTNLWGETWTVERILKNELAQPVNGAACGGTHRMMAISYATMKRRERGEPMTGHWRRAEKFVADYHRYTLSLQNHDGSFSSDWFRRRSQWGDVDRKLQTTGHILEWLVYTLPEERLYDPAIIRAVQFLTNLMIENRYHDWETGPRCHAIRALHVYYDRVFRPQEAVLAQQPAPVVPADRTKSERGLRLPRFLAPF